MIDQASIDNRIAEGYTFLHRNETEKACNIWLEAWEDFKSWMGENGIKSLLDINFKDGWTEHPVNYAQDLEMELHNAGVENKVYLEERITYCRDLLSYVGQNKLMESNTRRAIADSYFKIGDEVECDRLYRQWLDEDPKWGWGYIGWHDCYAEEFHGRHNIKKAGEIIQRALCEDDVRDRLDVVDRALDFYNENGGDETVVSSLREEFGRLKASNMSHATINKPTPVTVVKTGRNEPCPCGSGKKYKHCHGKS